MSDLAVILGDQLFEGLPGMPSDCPIFMREDFGLATRYRHHQQKLVLFFSAMRHFARSCEREVIYQPYGSDSLGYFEALTRVCETRGVTRVWFCPPNDPASFDLSDFPLEAKIVPSNPMFLTPPEEWQRYLSSTPRRQMSDFYIGQRKRLGILITEDGKPLGGKWSFDAENRKKLPVGLVPPPVDWVKPDTITEEVIELVAREFPDHPGDAREFRYAVTHEDAKSRLDHFLDQQLPLFGDYEDAISRRERTLYHSVLTPYLNCGLLTPRQVVDATLQREAPLNSKEGFLRQIIGWREFMFGMSQEYAEIPNYFGHQRRMNSTWYDGTTGLPPVDEAIDRAKRHAYCHHIERLMVLGSVMMMSEIHPEDVYRWFMEMFIDSAEWVMKPNVLGMSQYADGGMFTTKPYLSGSAYILKMSDWGRGDWCDVWDGLYWRLIRKHAETFAKNQRMSMIVRSVHRLPTNRAERIFNAAELFIDRVTCN